MNGSEASLPGSMTSLIQDSDGIGHEWRNV